MLSIPEGLRDAYTHVPSTAKNRSSHLRGDIGSLFDDRLLHWRPPLRILTEPRRAAVIGITMRPSFFPENSGALALNLDER